MEYAVEIAKGVRKQLEDLPAFVFAKLALWRGQILRFGLPEVRKIPGYHDEPLKGRRKGQRSIRLNRSYRAIYSLIVRENITIILIEEVSNHDY